MHFSIKKPALYIHEALIRARSIAIEQGLDPAKIRIIKAITGRGSYVKRVDYKGKGRHGIIKENEAYAKLLLKQDCDPACKRPRQRHAFENFVKTGRRMDYFAYTEQ